MAEQDFSTMTREHLEAKLAQEKSNNEDAEKGYALVYVLDPHTFAHAHIPGSINIPRGSEDEFEQRFSKSKEIIVYSFSPECDASPRVREELMSRGFVNVQNYGSGMSYWKAGKKAVARGNL